MFMLVRTGLVAFALSMLLFASSGCEDRAETFGQQVLGTWSVAGGDSFRSATAGQQYTFAADGTFTIREQRRLGPAGTLRAAYEVARDGSITFRDAAAVQQYRPSFAGDTLRLRTEDATDTLTLVRQSPLP